jgi:hypothetical protein
MFSLDCPYYNRVFSTIEELLNDILESGMDPNYNITKDGEVTGDIAFYLMPI